MQHVYAQAQVNIQDIFTPAKEFSNISAIVNIIIRNIMTVAAVATLVLLIFGGFGFMIAAGSGDAKKMEQRKKTVTSALVGITLIIASYWIIQIIEILTGLQLLKPGI